MGLVNFVISTLVKCLDVACFLLDLNFVLVHSVVQTVVAVITFITNLPTLLLTSLLELANFMVFCLMSTAEATSNVAQNTVTLLGSVVLALEGLLESLKMMGYLSMHVLLRGKEHLCRGLLWLLEGCGIAVSLVVYFTNTVVNFVLIATQNVYLAVVGLWHTVSSPLQKVLELTLTSLTFLYSSLVGTSAVLWSPCKLVLDFLVSLAHMFISIFILNIYGFILTVSIALTTTAYLNPELTQQAAAQILNYMNSFPALRRLYRTLCRLVSAMRRVPHVVHVNTLHLQRILHRLNVLERRLWRRLSRLSSELGLVLRTHLNRNRNNNNNRVRGDGDTVEERRGPPDGRAGDGAHQELRDLPSSSTDRPLKKLSSSGEGSKHLPAKDLLTLLCSRTQGSTVARLQ